MLTALVVAVLGAQPLSIYVETVRASPKYEAEAHVWTEALAGELRRYGFRVTTQDDLAAMLSGDKQRQRMGCEDKDCGLDPQIVTNGDAKLSATAAGEDGFLVSLTMYRMKPRMQPWASALGDKAYSEAMEGLREQVPRLIEAMRADAQPGQIPDGPTSNASEPKGATKKGCSVAGAAPMVLLALLLGRRRWRGASWR